MPIPVGWQRIPAAGKKITVPTEAERAEWDKAIQLCIDKWEADCIRAGSSAADFDKVLAA